MRIRVLLLLPLLLPLAPGYLAAGSPVSYDIVYVRAPRAGDNTYIRFPDVFFPTAMPPGSDLMLLHPDGTEETLFSAQGKGAVLDPVVSFDAQWVYFAYIPDNTTQTGINYQRGLSTTGSDLYKINLATRQVLQLTHQEWTPPSSLNWSSNLLSASSPNSIYLGFGIFNMSPCPLPNGKLMFVSSRDSYSPNKGYTTPNLRLYIMDDDGQNVEPIGHNNIGSALQPVALMDGRVMFSSFETEGNRDERDWSLWAIWPDGRHWEPLLSALDEGVAFHFQTQLSDGRVAVTWYYNLNDNGFGTILGLDPTKTPGAIPFGSPNPTDSSNPQVQVGLWQAGSGSPLQPRYFQFAFSPPGLVNLTAFTYGFDSASPPLSDGTYAGKATHPAAAPNDDLLLSWTPGPANNLDRPTNIPVYDSGIYLLKGGQALTDSHNLVLIKNDPNYNEMEPRPVVTYQAIYGMPQPNAFPYLPNDGSVSSLLPAGTPFGLIGTSSFYNRNTSPGYGNPLYAGMDSFNTSQNSESSNWFSQGDDDGVYTNDDIYAVRVLAMEGAALRSYPNGGDSGFLNFAGHERLRILGEIPVRNTNNGKPVIDAQGNPDTSFLAKIPADTPVTFQTLDKDGLLLNMAQTWHMVRPGEVRNDCGGCHAHHQVPLDFSTTAAAQPNYQVHDLTVSTPLLSKDSSGNTIVKDTGKLLADVEYYRDIKPILQRSCVQCHTGSTPAGNLVLDDTSVVNGYENTYNRLANDANAQYGYKPVIPAGIWRQTNSSRYVRMFQSRRSLLAWKIFGRRLDGWLNSDHPTESTPGDPTTLPAGANPDDADIDFTGTIMPPPGSSAPPLSDDEKMMFARWIDLGAPISSQADPTYKGYFSDELKPTLTLSSPRSGANTQALSVIRIGMFDTDSGINAQSLSVTANFPVNGVAAGGELAGLFNQSNSIWQLNLSSPITSLSAGHLLVKVKDNAGNLSFVDRTFSVAVVAPPTVTMTAPANNATVSATTTVSAQVQSSAYIASVQFLLDGVALGAAQTSGGPSYSVSWDTTTATNGAHTLSARATDSIGNIATSSLLQVTVNNSVMPQGTPLLSGAPATYLRNDFAGYVGMQFTVGSTSLVVSQLGRWVAAASTQTHTLKLVDANGVDLPGGSTSLNLNGAAKGQFSYAALATPITLAANATYYLVTQEFVGGDPWYDFGPVNANSAVSINQAAYYWGGSYISIGPPSCYGTVNLLFAPGAVGPPPLNTLLSGHSNASLRNNYDGFVGLKFTTGSNAIQVTQLGRWVVNGNSHAHVVKLADASGNDLPSASVSLNTSGATPGQYAFATLPNPITLPANTSFFLATQESSGGDQWYDFGPVTVNASVGTVNSAAYLYNGIYYLLGGSSEAYGTPNFVWEQANGQVPNVSITAPAAGATVSGVITLTANASATGALSIAAVQFELNGAKSGPALLAAPYTTTLDTTELANGSYTLTAIATDSAGNTATSASMTITVSNGVAKQGSPLVTGAPSPVSRLRNDYAGYVGAQLTVGSTPITVTQLGRWVAATKTNSQTHIIKLVDAKGVDVPGASVSLNLSAVSGGQYAFAPLAATVTLAANTSYFLMTQEFAGGDFWYDLGPVSVSPQAGRFSTAAYQYNGTYYLPGGPAFAYGPPNLLFY